MNGQKWSFYRKFLLVFRYGARSGDLINSQQQEMRVTVTEQTSFVIVNKILLTMNTNRYEKHTKTLHNSLSTRLFVCTTKSEAIMSVMHTTSEF